MLLIKSADPRVSVTLVSLRIPRLAERSKVSRDATLSYAIASALDVGRRNGWSEVAPVPTFDRYHTWRGGQRLQERGVTW